MGKLRGIHSRAERQFQSVLKDKMFRASLVSKGPGPARIREPMRVIWTWEASHDQEDLIQSQSTPIHGFFLSDTHAIQCPVRTAAFELTE